MADIDLLQLADFSRKVLVVGDLNLNITIDGAYKKIAAEAPIPVFYEATKTYSVAGAANVARNIRALGIDVDIVGVISTLDEIVPNALAKENIRSEWLIRLDDYSPETVTRYFEDGVQLFQSHKAPLSGNTVKTREKILHQCTQQVDDEHYAAMILVDNGHGIMSVELAQSLVQLAAGHNIPTIARLCQHDMSKFSGADYVLANANVTSSDKPYPETKDTEEQDGHTYLISKFNIKRSLVMLSTDELSWIEPNNNCFQTMSLQYSGRKRGSFEHKLPDGVLSAIGFGVACRLSNQQTISLLTMVAEYLAKPNHKQSLNLIDLLPSKVIYTPEQLTNFVKFLPKNKKVVLTTGCYDLLHAGHADNLRLAKEFGDILIILLNSDASVKKLKGPSRPVFTQVDRVKLLSVNKHVDFIVLFDEKKPSEQVRLIDPDVLVKGDDYTEDRVRKAYPFVKEVGITDGPPCIGTTGFIAKIKAGKTE